ncbi:MAG: hypothetical protein ACJ0BR_05390 [Candidatus Puniceispirillales bacterium]
MKTFLCSILILFSNVTFGADNYSYSGFGKKLGVISPLDPMFNKSTLTFKCSGWRGQWTFVTYFNKNYLWGYSSSQNGFRTILGYYNKERSNFNLDGYRFRKSNNRREKISFSKESNKPIEEILFFPGLVGSVGKQGNCKIFGPLINFYEDFETSQNIDFKKDQF